MKLEEKLADVRESMRAEAKRRVPRLDVYAEHLQLHRRLSRGLEIQVVRERHDAAALPCDVEHG